MANRKCGCGELIPFGVVSIGKTRNNVLPEHPDHIHWFNCPKCRTTFIVYSKCEVGPTPEEFLGEQKELAEN